MSHAKNKVDWCLKKAESELQQGTKHRGLVQTKENFDEAVKHIVKSEHNLLAIDYFNTGGFSDWSMSALFYCIYHCFLAIISKFGYESRNQECTIALVRFLLEEKKMNISEKFIDMLENYNEQERHESSIIEKREHYTYGTSISTDNVEEIKQSIELGKDCLNETKKIIYEK